MVDFNFVKRRRRATNFQDLVVKIQLCLFALIFMLFLLRGFFVSGSTAKEQLERLDYKEVKVVTKEWAIFGFFDCGFNPAKFKIEVLNYDDKKISITACVDWPYRGIYVKDAVIKFIR